MVEHLAVNERVLGSNPSQGAINQSAIGALEVRFLLWQKCMASGLWLRRRGMTGLWSGVPEPAGEWFIAIKTYTKNKNRSAFH